MNVSLLCICDFCAKSFRIQSFHAGFSEQLYFYCDNCTNTLLAPISEVGGQESPRNLDDTTVHSIEAMLPSCIRCGGSFRYYNSFLCPHCKKPYIDFETFPEERRVEYYGNYLYGTKPQAFGKGSK